MSEPPPVDRPVTPDRRVPVLLGATLVSVIVLGGLWLSLRPAQGQLQGFVDVDEVTVAAKITARAVQLHVHEGDRVQAGQLLLTLASPEVDARQEQALGALDSARAQAAKADDGARPQEIDALAAQWRRAQAGADLAQTTLQHTDTLFREGVLTRQKHDEAYANARAATEAAVAAKAQYDQARAGARIEDRQAASGQLRQARGALAEVAAAEAETSLRAPISGEISKRMVDVGEIVPAGYPAFTLIDRSRQWVVLNVREDQFARVKLGAVLRGDVPALGVKGAAFTVYYIAPSGDYATWRATRQSSGYDVRTFQVRLRSVGDLNELRPGMSVLVPWPQ